MEDKISAIDAKVEDVPAKMTVDKFAERVASDISRGSTGKMATTLKYPTSLPETMVVSETSLMSQHAPLLSH